MATVQALYYMHGSTGPPILNVTFSLGEAHGLPELMQTLDQIEALLRREWGLEGGQPQDDGTDSTGG